MEASRTEKKPKSRGGQRGNSNNLQHGYYALKGLLNGGRLDKRTAIYRALREKEQELISALGGSENVSPQEVVLIGDSVRVMMYTASLDNYLMGLKSLVRKGKVRDAVIQRVKLGGHLRENLKHWGSRECPKRSRTLRNSWRI